jgi:acetyl esterase/lipase
MQYAGCVWEKIRTFVRMMTYLNIRAVSLSILLLASITLIHAQEIKYETKSNIHYYSNDINLSDSYINERCVLDVYYPTNSKNFATVVWFHGGGLTGGNKEIPAALKEKNVCIVGVNYRLYPKIKAPKYIEDAAAAVSWVFNNISNYGGDPSLIFVSGHSAGAYLANMICLDKSWLNTHHVDANKIAGLISLSGHTITHFAIREERGIAGTQAVVDSLAPLFHVRADAPPILLITGDRELEMLGRYEENAYLMRMMKLTGHKDIKLYELQGYGHIMTEPAFPLLLNEVKRIKDAKH